MAEFVKWDRPRGSVHNLQQCLTLKDTGCNILILSDASLYVIQNWLAMDIEFKARWADEILDKGYKPIATTSANYEAWVDLVHQIQGECVDVSCDVVGAIEELRDQMLVTNSRLEDIRQEVANLVTATSAQQTEIDDLEPILDAINVILGGTAVLVGA